MHGFNGERSGGLSVDSTEVVKTCGISESKCLLFAYTIYFDCDGALQAATCVVP